MMTDKEYERNLSWLSGQVQQKRAKTDVRSIVTYGKGVDQYLLCSFKGRLRLENERKVFFRAPLEEVHFVVWCKRGLWMQLGFMINAQEYHCKFRRSKV